MTPPLWQKVKRNKKATWWGWKRKVKKLAWNLNIQETKIMASSPITSLQKKGESGGSDRFSFLGLQNYWGWWWQPWNLKRLASWKESHEKARQHNKKQRHHFAAFLSSLLQMWELDHGESWAPKNWNFQIVVLEKTLESPLDYKIKLVNPNGNQPWIFIGRSDAEAESPTFWPPDLKSRLIGKDPDAGKDWKQKEKRATEDEMAR